MPEKSRFTSDRRAPSSSSWRDDTDWAAGVAEDVDVVAGGLIGRPPNQHSESPDSVIESFEDGDVAEWSITNSVQTFEAVSASGEAKGDCMGRMESDGSTGTAERSVSLSEPSALRVLAMYTSFDSRATYVFQNADADIFSLRDINGESNLLVNGVDTGVSRQTNSWFDVVAYDIDWQNNMIGRVEINESEVLTDVAFDGSTSNYSVETLVLDIGGNPIESYSDCWSYSP